MNLLKSLKVRIKVFFRMASDVFYWRYFYLVRKQSKNIHFDYFLNLNQEIKPSETFENKIYNIALASGEINQYVIMPNEIFSFWRIIGNPNKKYKKSRSIVKGKIEEDTGGGLCQVSGIIYYISLLSGMEIIERHNHSIDIYTEETRFTPLGTDATVVYGYKDLRLKNNLPFPIKFHLETTENKLTIKLLSVRAIIENTLLFETVSNENNKTVTVKDKQNNILNVSKYNKAR